MSLIKNEFSGQIGNFKSKKGLKCLGGWWWLAFNWKSMTSSEDSSSCYVGKVNFDIDYQFVCDALNQTLINVRDFYVCEQNDDK